MVGSILYPLNVLKQIHPEIYSEHVKKYDERQHLLTREIPILNCLWNDVLHFTVISPEDVKNNLEKAGFYYEPMSWYKIPVGSVEQDKCIALTYHIDRETGIETKEYQRFDHTKMDLYRIILPETIEYYIRKKKDGADPLLFHLVPHILYRGNIDIGNTEIIVS